MAHIVCITGGLTGMRNASLALVQQLVAAGHRVTYASPADLRDAVTAQGIPYVQLDKWVMQSGDPSGMSRWAKLRSLRERQQRAVKALGVQTFVPKMRELAPDLLLIDIEMHPHIMAAVMAQLPVALLCPFLSIWKRPGLPPIHTELLPEEGWRGQRLGLTWSWLRYGWAKWQESQLERWRRMGLDWNSVLHHHARQIGYPLKSRIGLQQWLVPYPDRDFPILCLNALELDFPHDPHPSMHYTGPMVFDSSHSSPIEAATEQALDTILEQRQLSGRSLIYCGCSSLAKIDQTFLQNILTAAANTPQWDWIIGLGGQITPEELAQKHQHSEQMRYPNDPTHPSTQALRAGSAKTPSHPSPTDRLRQHTLALRLPPNLHAFTWAPQPRILQQANCAIISSGINSINECIDANTPMLVYSLQCADQNGNAARIRYHQLGIVSDRQNTDATQIVNHVQTLLTDSSYRQNVAKMRDRFHHYVEENCAVRIVESLLDSRQGGEEGMGKEDVKKLWSEGVMR